MSDLDVINDGLVRLGAPPVASLNDASAQSIGAGNIYPREKASVLAEFPWSFAVREVQLSPMALPESEREWTGYKCVFELPIDRVRVLGLRSKDTFWITGSRLHADEQNPRLVYVSNAPESVWPSWFARAVSLRFAAAAAVMITDATTRAELMYNEAQRAIQTARSLDSQQVPRDILNLAGIYAKRNRNFMAGV